MRADTVAGIEAAVAAGRTVVTEDAFTLLAAEGIDCLVDVTGAVEFGARVTVAAIERGLPVVTMNAELDGTVGPLLAHRARKAGVVLTGADGDQPGVQGNLLRFVRGLGVKPLVAGNVKGLQDEYRTPATQRGFAERWGRTCTWSPASPTVRRSPSSRPSWPTPMASRWDGAGCTGASTTVMSTS